MKLSFVAFFISTLVTQCTSYSAIPVLQQRLSFVTASSPRAQSQLFSSASPSEEEIKRRSRLEGNIRDPTPQDVSIMDEMITKLSLAKPYELPDAVRRAFRVVKSPRFFLRIAERTDMAKSKEEKERLSALATNLVSTLEAVISTAEDRIAERAKEVESVVKQAAEPDGEFLVPLSPERIEAMRDAVQKMESISLDEGFLSTVDAYMNKSMQDGLDGMVVILQKVLQIYAGTEISRARKRLRIEVGAAVTGEDVEVVEDAVEREGVKPSGVLMEKLLAMDTDLWDEELNNSVPELCTAKQILGEVQRTIEGVVLGLENGSMAQRVQAEFLRELVSRIEKLEGAE